MKLIKLMDKREQGGSIKKGEIPTAKKILEEMQKEKLSLE